MVAEQIKEVSPYPTSQIHETSCLEFLKFTEVRVFRDLKVGDWINCDYVLKPLQFVKITKIYPFLDGGTLEVVSQYGHKLTNKIANVSEIKTETNKNQTFDFGEQVYFATRNKRWKYKTALISGLGVDSDILLFEKNGTSFDAKTSECIKEYALQIGDEIITSYPINGIAYSSQTVLGFSEAGNPVVSDILEQLVEIPKKSVVAVL
jgi:hypothetical protein